VADLDEDGKSEALCYLDTEKLRRVNGDGSDRPVGDVNTVCTRGVDIFSLAAVAMSDVALQPSQVAAGSVRRHWRCREEPWIAGERKTG
jgi:hypothetical protein